MREKNLGGDENWKLKSLYPRDKDGEQPKTQKLQPNVIKNITSSSFFCLNFTSREECE